MAHKRYLDEEIANALTLAPSLIGASRLLGMSTGAMVKRMRSNPELRRLWMECRKRGLKMRGKQLSNGFTGEPDGE